MTRPRRAWGWLLAVAGCRWVSDDDLRARFDADGDGYPVSSDCNDESAAVGALEPTRELACGEAAEGVLGATADLSIANCLHPLAPDTLAHYGAHQDVWRLVPPSSGEVVVTFEAGDGFAQSDPDQPDEPGFDLGGIAVIAWRDPTCERSGCVQATPVGRPAQLAGQEPWVARVSFVAEAGEAWSLVVSGDLDAPYTLDAACGP